MMQWILSKHKSMMKNAGLKTKDWNGGVKSFPIVHSGASIPVWGQCIQLLALLLHNHLNNLSYTISCDNIFQSLNI